MSRSKEPKIIDTTGEYDRITIRVSKGRKAILQVHASKKNESLTAFINRAIDNQLLRDS